MPATVLIADDHTVVAEALAVVLGQWYTVLGCVNTLEALAARLQETSPDVVVLDLSFRQTNSLTVLPDLVATYPRVRFVILTANVARVLVDAARKAGAIGFVIKESGSPELKLAIDEALQGREFISPLLRPGHDTTGEWRKLPKGGSHPGQPSERAMTVLGYLHQGVKQSEIAVRMGITRQAVEYQIRRASECLGISGTGMLIRWYEQHKGRE